MAIKKNPRFKNHWQKTPSKGLHTIGESQTIPNQAISVREILRRFRSGLPLEGVVTSKPVFEEEEIPDFKKMDMTELDEYKERIKNTYEEYQNHLKDEENNRKKAEFDKKVEDEIEKRTQQGKNSSGSDKKDVTSS